VLLGIFPFAGPDCAAMTERVLEALELSNKSLSYS